jgi:chromate transport protein ChrA
MKKIWYVTSIAVIAFASVYLFEWNGDTMLHILTGMIAGVLVMKAIDDWKGAGSDHESR